MYFCVVLCSKKRSSISKRFLTTGTSKGGLFTNRHKHVCCVSRHRSQYTQIKVVNKTAQDIDIVSGSQIIMVLNTNKRTISLVKWGGFRKWDGRSLGSRIADFQIPCSHLCYLILVRRCTLNRRSSPR